MPSRMNLRYRPAPVFKGLPIDCQGATRHFPGLGILTKIVQAWAAAGIRTTQSDLSGEDVERTVDLAFVQPVAVQVYQEIPLGPRAEALIPAFRVVGQYLTSRGMQRNQTGLSELSPSNRENAFGPIHIPPSEAERLAQPHSCDPPQTEKAVVGPGP